MAGGAIWSLAGSVITRGVSLAYSIVAARILGLEEFGALGVIITTVGMTQMLAGMGLGITATKHIAEFRRVNPLRAGRIIALCELSSLLFGLVMSILLIVLAPWLAVKVLAHPNLARPLVISSAMLLLGTLTGAQAGTLVGFEAFKTVARVNAIASLAGIPFMIAGGYVGGLNGFLWGMTAPLVVQLVLNHIALRRVALDCGVPIVIAECWQERHILLGFSLPAFLGNITAAIVNWTCATMLVNSSNGYREMGIYSAAFQWYNVLIFLPGVIGQVALPMLSERHGDLDPKRVLEILKKALGINAIVVLPLVVAGWIASPLIMSIYGEGFRGAGLTLAITVTIAGLISLEMPLVDLIASTGRMWHIAFMNLGWAVALIALSSLAVHRGALGMVAARLAAYLVYSLILFYIAYRTFSEMRRIPLKV